MCLQLDTDNSNSNISVTIFANEGQFSYSTQLNNTLEIPVTDFTNGSEANGSISVIAKYSNTATGTSRNSSAINIPGIRHFTVMFSIPMATACSIVDLNSRISV